MRFKVSKVTAPSEADGKCATENPLCEDLFEEGQKPKGVTKSLLTLWPFPPVLWRVCLPAQRRNEKQKTMPLSLPAMP